MGSVPIEKLLDAIRGVLAAAAAQGWQVPTSLRPLREVEAAWVGESGRARTVFRM